MSLRPPNVQRFLTAVFDGVPPAPVPLPKRDRGVYTLKDGTMGGHSTFYFGEPAGTCATHFEIEYIPQISQEYSGAEDGDVYLNSLKTDFWALEDTDPRECLRKGYATKVLRYLTDLADAHGVPLVLEVSPYAHRSVSKAGLKRFYRSHGFTPQGRGIIMRRPPRQGQPMKITYIPPSPTKSPNPLLKVEPEPGPRRNPAITPQITGLIRQIEDALPFPATVEVEASDWNFRFTFKNSRGQLVGLFRISTELPESHLWRASPCRLAWEEMGSPKPIWVVRAAEWFVDSARGKGLGKLAYKALFLYAGRGASVGGKCTQEGTSPSAERVWISFKRRYVHYKNLIKLPLERLPRENPKLRIEPLSRFDDPYTLDVDNLGKGAFKRVYRTKGRAPKALAVAPEALNLEIMGWAAHQLPPRSRAKKHIPLPEKIGWLGDDPIYEMPLYKTPLRKADSPEAWKQYLLLKRAVAAASEQQLTTEGFLAGRFTGRSKEAVAQRRLELAIELYRSSKGRQPSIASAMQSIYEAILDHWGSRGEFVWEITPRNLGTDKKGTLILLDPFFDRSRLVAALEARLRRLPRHNPPGESKFPMLMRHIVRGMFVKGLDKGAHNDKRWIQGLVKEYEKEDGVGGARKKLNLAFGTTINSLRDLGLIKEGRRGWVLTEAGKKASAKKRREQSKPLRDRKSQQYEWILEAVKA